MTFTKAKILAAFEATGLHPLTARKTIKPAISNKKSRNVERFDSSAPRTTRHGKSIFIHTRRTLSLMNDATPGRRRTKLMVEKVGTSAAKSAAQVVVLEQELNYLRREAKAATDSLKVHSPKSYQKH